MTEIGTKVLRLLLMLLMLWTAGDVETKSIVVNPECAALTREETLRMVERVSEDFYADHARIEELDAELRQVSEVVPTEQFEAKERTFYVLSHAGTSMRFFMEKRGQPGENGRYPLYLTLHGGGGISPEENNDQWIDMFNYYRDAVQDGIYIACRGITDTWDLHFREESYVLYDRLIEEMTARFGADPDRVYLLGFSAGGDGVYQIAPRLADRFAAVNMSSGHPNGVSLLNLANCPICLQAGIRDYYSEDGMRSVRAAEFEKTLSDYRERYGFGYEHRVLIHVPAGHNYNDYEDNMSVVLKDPAEFARRAVPEKMLDLFLGIMRGSLAGLGVADLSYFSTEFNALFDRQMMEAVTDRLGLEVEEVNSNAVGYVSRFTRDPAPEKLVWDLSTRAKKREKDTFYWLEAAPEADRGIIMASFDAESNTITVDVEGEVNGEIAILFHPALVDVSRPVTVKAGGRETVIEVHPSEAFLKASMLENGDPGLACVGKVLYSSLIWQDR